jgi:hypothetical protein
LESQQFILWTTIIGIVTFTLWRNYGVKAKNEVIIDSAFGKDTDRTNEQKELIKKIHNSYIRKMPNKGDSVRTSFGFYRFTNGVWIKYAEIWES